MQGLFTYLSNSYFGHKYYDINIISEIMVFKDEKPKHFDWMKSFQNAALCIAMTTKR